MKNKLTIRDIAKLAGVSPSTVSRVLSKSDYPVSEEIRERVVKVAKDNMYIPNLFGRKLRNATLDEIGIMIPDFSNPFYSYLLSMIDSSLISYDYFPLVCSSMNSVERERLQITRLLQRNVAGIILTNLVDEGQLLRDIQSSGTPFVVIESTSSETDYPSVSFNFRQAGKMAADYLISCGHHNICFMTPYLDRLSRKYIYSGIKAAVREAAAQGQDIKEQLVVLDSKTLLDATLNVKFLTERFLQLPERPGAIIAHNDNYAISIMNALSKEGLKVPDDVSIIGFDDLPIAEQVQPKLSTVRQNISLSVHYAMTILNGLINGNVKQQHYTVSPELIIRESVKNKNVKD